MSGTKTVRIRTENGVSSMSTGISPAAAEAFQLLNAGAKKHWRGQGDTWTAARDRAAVDAGCTVAQGERLQKNWKSMKFPNADVYRLLRNKYGHLLPNTYDRLCAYIENKAEAIEREAQQIEERNAADRGHQAAVARHPAPPRREERELT